MALAYECNKYNFCVPNDIKRLNYSFWFHFGGIATVHKFITILRSSSNRKILPKFKQELNQMQQSLALTLYELQEGTQSMVQNCYHYRL